MKRNIKMFEYYIWIFYKNIIYKINIKNLYILMYKSDIKPT